MSRKPPGPEELLHRSVIEWLGWVKPDVVFFHSYNGAYMSKATAGRGKAMGVLPGVADLVFVLPGGKVGFIELKVLEEGLSDNQKAFHDNVRKLGASTTVARSIEGVQTILKSWGVTFAHARGRAA